jgi:hypothetical protein
MVVTEVGTEAASVVATMGGGSSSGGEGVLIDNVVEWW